MHYLRKKTLAHAIVEGHTDLYSEEEIHVQFNTNVFGPIRVIKGALPSLRKTGGTIVNITSVAGYDGLPSCSMYAGSKFALEGMSVSLFCTSAGIPLSLGAKCPRVTTVLPFLPPTK